jgi:manganese oxidase
MDHKSKRNYLPLWTVAYAVLLVPLWLSGAEAKTVVAEVVALDQAITLNRLGAMMPGGMMFALRRDIEPIDPVLGLVAGNVRVRADKRPRPLVLRMNVGDRLRVRFQNLLDPIRVVADQPATRSASVHVAGLQLVGSIASDGSNVGNNPSSLVPPNGVATYNFIAGREGTYLLSSQAAIAGGEVETGSKAFGLFGAVNVEATGAEYYRSQVTEEDLRLASQDANGSPMLTADGHPIINYDAVYPVGHRFAGIPILKMLDADNHIVHSDLNAIITGPNRGHFPAGTYPVVPVAVPTVSDDAVPRTREEPFREFTVIFHDEIARVDAFRAFFLDPVLGHTLHGVGDGFAINYGSGGVGSEIIANRLNVGPMHDCTECKFEEFFLTSWAVGDPAMIVDVLANDGLLNLPPGQAPPAGTTGPKATKALFPDDPSNVHHSYLNDHVKMRNVHAGKEHHIFHLHSHQWLFTPDDDNSMYLDAQHIGPSAAYNYEIVYNGGGNRNLTPGDAIFHCHFYPHFAQGMWELWRNHDVFEAGTVLDANGVPAAGARALPDGEIVAGTPIPALVPLPGRPMAPMPGEVHIAQKVGQPGGQVEFADPSVPVNPGYPFFIAGIAGHRPPTPPLDVEDDGGLPRHVITGGVGAQPTEHFETRLNFDKTLLSVAAIQIPEDGTNAEKAAMAFHGVGNRFHNTFLPDGTQVTANAGFKTNGRAPQPGAPYADPCVDDLGNVPAGVNQRTYKAAAIQLDMAMNKVGWHFAQSRMLSLWNDVAGFQSGAKPPEPLFFRANSNDCITFHHTNLVPNVYEADDYQVRTPTDVIGQHIHLVKFDVTSSDGSGNGFNYEDGTFSPQEVIERINAINTGNAWTPIAGGPALPLAAANHPFFGVPGARTTIQRWYADSVLNRQGEDRTLQSVFTHDHFGPSTHQQAGLYGTFAVQPEGSSWFDPETGVQFGAGREDGGPTSWRANIITADRSQSYREFLFQLSDFQQAYKADAQFQDIVDPGSGNRVVGKFDAQKVINGPAREEVPLPIVVARSEQCPGGVPLPCPEAIMAKDPGTAVVNYRNEPLVSRVFDPLTSAQALGMAGDLSFVYRSDVPRTDARLNVQPAVPLPLTADVQPGDPFTPIIRAYQGDKIKIRAQVGATEESHTVTIHGVRWLQEPFVKRSGYRNSQGMGISEQFTFNAPLVPVENVKGDFTDHLYKMGASVEDQWNGAWGLLRAYDRDKLRADLKPLPNNTVRQSEITNLDEFRGVCPRDAPVRRYDITAVAASRALTQGTLVYNRRLGNVPGVPGPLHDPTAILYVHTKDLGPGGILKPGVPIEPLVLRACAGECIQVTLRNRLPQNPADLDGFSILPFLEDNFNANQVRPSKSVGLHPQLVSVDASMHDGTNVGLNVQGRQTVDPGNQRLYRWYAGTLEVVKRKLVATPVEFGASNLMPADPIKHASKGAVGALIIEPEGASWKEDRRSRAAATVTTRNGSSFREFVLVFQTDINMRDGLDQPVAVVPAGDDAEDSGQKAFNYRSEPFWFRMGFHPSTPGGQTNDKDYSSVLSNSLTGGRDPVTPVFRADARMPTRFRLVHPGGHTRNHVFEIHGHAWQREPYNCTSRRLASNLFSQWRSAQEGIGASGHWDMVLENGAGGKLGIKGDYLFRDHNPVGFTSGLWGIFRVE